MHSSFDRFRSLIALAADAATMLAAYYLSLALRVDFGTPAYGWMQAHMAAVVVVALQMFAMSVARAHRDSWGRFRIKHAVRMAAALCGAAAFFILLRIVLPNHFWARPPYTVSLINAVVCWVSMMVTRILYAAWLAEKRKEPLFGRAAETELPPEVKGFFAGRRVMVTGAGGTIGSEICRQVASLGPESLVLVERSENALYEIDRRLRVRAKCPLFPEMVDIRESARMEKLFEEHRPEIVIHAAAYKHVPMVEMNPREGLANNFLATLDLAELSVRHGVKRFVFISTDKAVDPSSVMGATKRLGELAMCVSGGSEIFRAVRFGNVIGSSGIVIPLFEEQVAEGGPITVTDARMTRYFMSVAEAVSLVLRAAAMEGNDRLYVLDMGRPRRIVEVAEEIARRHGYRPYRDMPIVFTGIRGGEKLEEDLGVNVPGARRTAHGKIFALGGTSVTQADIAAIAARAKEICASEMQDDEVRTAVLSLASNGTRGSGAAAS